MCLGSFPRGRRTGWEGSEGWVEVGVAGTVAVGVVGDGATAEGRTS